MEDAISRIRPKSVLDLKTRLDCKGWSSETSFGNDNSPSIATVKLNNCKAFDSEVGLENYSMSIRTYNILYSVYDPSSLETEVAEIIITYPPDEEGYNKSEIQILTSEFKSNKKILDSLSTKSICELSQSPLAISSNGITLSMSPKKCQELALSQKKLKPVSAIELNSSSPSTAYLLRVENETIVHIVGNDKDVTIIVPRDVNVDEDLLYRASIVGTSPSL